MKKLRFLFFFSLIVASCEIKETEISTVDFNLNNDQSYLYLSVVNISRNYSEIEYKSSIFDQTNLSPMMIPTEAYGHFLDKNVYKQTKLFCQSEDNSECFRQEIVESDDISYGNLKNQDDSNETYVSINRSILSDYIDQKIIEINDDVLYIAIGIYPKIEFDQYKYIDWFNYFNDLQDKNLYKKILIEGDKLRREYVKKIVDFSKQSLENYIFEKNISCEIISVSDIDNDLILKCQKESVYEVSNLENLRYFNIYVPGTPTGDMSGSAYRSDYASQLRLYLTQDDQGTLCGALGGTRPCYDGSVNGSTIRVGLIDGQGFDGTRNFDSLPNAHVAYRASNYYASNQIMRVNTYEKCNISSCSVLNSSTWSPPNPPNTPHGTQTMSPAFSSVLDMQHPWFTLSDREAHSYGAYGALLNLYWFTEAFSLEKAIESAPLDLSDVIVVSWSGVSNCHAGNFGYELTKTAWDYAYSLGSLGVVSASNAIYRNNDNCTVNPYTSRDDILVVGGIREYGSSLYNFDYDLEPIMGFPYSSYEYANDNCPLAPAGTTTCWHSALGGANLLVLDVNNNPAVRSYARSKIDLVAPDGYLHVPKYDGNNNYHYFDDNSSGTSVSAPLVAAATVSLLDWARDQGVNQLDDPSMLHNVMLLMGDGSREMNGSAPPIVSYRASHRLWGFGKMKMRIFEPYGMDAPWEFSTWSGNISRPYVPKRIIAIGQGQSGTPLNNDIDEVVVVMSWNESNVNPLDTNKFAADIILEVGYTEAVNGQCTHPGHNAAITIPHYKMTDFSYDTHKVVRIKADLINLLRTKCVWASINGYSTPMDENNFYGRKVYLSYYVEDRDRESLPNTID